MAVASILISDSGSINAFASRNVATGLTSQKVFIKCSYYIICKSNVHYKYSNSYNILQQTSRTFQYSFFYHFRLNVSISLSNNFILFQCCCSGDFNDVINFNSAGISEFIFPFVLEVMLFLLM